MSNIIQLLMWYNSKPSNPTGKQKPALWFRGRNRLGQEELIIPLKPDKPSSKHNAVSKIHSNKEKELLLLLIKQYLNRQKQELKVETWDLQP